jgi:hypothetical protein
MGQSGKDALCQGVGLDLSTRVPELLGWGGDAVIALESQQRLDHNLVEHFRSKVSPVV